MSKRRVFDIDFPDDTPTEAAVPAGTEDAARRGPMASAIVENATALRERQAAEAAIRAENDRLAHEHVRLKKQGLVVDLIPVDAVRITKLTRDRSAKRDPELDELKTSIRAIGLSNPIRVEQGADGYELVQGFRRLSAYRELFAETGDDAFRTIPAGLLAAGETMDGLYRRMVDENLVRRDISFAEMAELARGYARDEGTACESIEEAIGSLYASAGRQKRNYILHFANLLEALGSALKFPESIPRALGLDLEKKIESRAGEAARIKARLAAEMPTTPETEVALLRTLLAEKPAPSKVDRVGEAAKAKTTFRLTVPAGTVRCAAQSGLIELRAERDFSGDDRQKLQRAVEAFFAALDT